MAEKKKKKKKKKAVGEQFFFKWRPVFARYDLDPYPTHRLRSVAPTRVAEQI